MNASDRVPLRGSVRPPSRDARLLGRADPSRVIEVTVRVRPRVAPARQDDLEAPGAPPAPARSYPSREEYARTHGADPADLQAVAAFAQAHGLQVKESSVAERRLTLAGTVQAFEQAFGVTLQRYAVDGGSYQAPSGPVQLPVELAERIEAMLGFDDRPYATPHDT